MLGLQNYNAYDYGTGVTSVAYYDQVIYQANTSQCRMNKIFKTILRTIIATDNCSNAATATQIITVIDNNPPTFSFSSPYCTCSQLQSPYSPCYCGRPVNIWDDCYFDPDETGQYSHLNWTDSYHFPCEGFNYWNRTWMVSDFCGNINATTYQLFVSPGK